MSWSFSIGRLAGTDIRIHFTFLLLLGFYLLVAGPVGTLLVLSFFFCVLLHEFGHVFAARAFGIRTPDVTLLPIGGLARLERMPRSPRQELIVALAGPAVNVVIAGLLFPIIGGIEGLRAVAVTPGQFDLGGMLPLIMMANVFMAVFNLIPAFPMDGGRVLRALLATKLDYARATQVAASVGQVIAVAGGLWALVHGHNLLILVAVFVFVGAAQEAASVRIEVATHGLPVTAAMITHFQSLSPQDTLQRAVDALLAGSQHDFPVVDGGGRLRGLLTRSDLIRALTEQGPGHPVYSVARQETPVIPSDWMLTPALQRLSESGLPTLAVVCPTSGQLVGLLTSENVAEMIMVAQAADQRRRRLGVPPPPPATPAA